MKRIIAIIVFALATLVTVPGAIAQDHRIRVTVPFNFNVDGTPLPAGTYTITSEDLLSIHIQNGKQSITVLRSAPAEDNASEHDKLVFNRYGNQYFLSKILCSYAFMNLEMPVSKIEKMARLQEANPRGNIHAFLALNR
jgi:hypothetical protein